MKVQDGKYRLTDVVDIEGMFRNIVSSADVLIIGDATFDECLKLKEITLLQGFAEYQGGSFDSNIQIKGAQKKDGKGKVLILERHIV